MPRLRLLVLVLVLGPLACASPVGVERRDPRDVRAELFEDVLSSGELSHASELVLHRRGLARAFEDDPDEVVAELHQQLPDAPDRAALLFALAELSFLRGDETSLPGSYLAAAIYAWAFLFPVELADRPEELDPRTRLAADLYNRGLARGLRPEGSDFADLSPRAVALPFGTLTLRVTGNGADWAGYHLVDLQPADDFAVRGLRSRYRQPGIGAPFVAGLEALPGEPGPMAARIPRTIRVPVTVLLRPDDLQAGLHTGRLSGQVELHVMGEQDSVEVAGQQVPLEYEPSVAFALALEGSDVWSAEYSGFFRDRIASLPAESDGLFLLRPYHPGQIPVVLVHGTASSPGRWAEVLNELAGDPLLRNRVTPWLFFYATGNPILLSSQRLRAALTDAVHELDPQGIDPALRHLVLVGHSQGGLLVRLQVTDSGTRFWDAISDEPLDQIGLEPDVEAWLESAFFFDRLPFVDRVVFMATPHRGSYLATDRISALAARLVSAPLRFSQASLDAVFDRAAAKLRRQLRRLPTSIDNMRPGSSFIETLATSTLAEGVTAHSIIAVRDDGPLEEGSDGVVEYPSAHLEVAVSEKVVRSGHSMQAHPDAIAELKRILREQVAALDALQATQPKGLPVPAAPGESKP